MAKTSLIEFLNNQISNDTDTPEKSGMTASSKTSKNNSLTNRTFRDLAKEVAKSKIKTRRVLTILFAVMLSIQLFFVFVLLFFIGFKSIHLDQNIIITFMTTVMVETIGLVWIIVKFNFDMTPEIEALKHSKD